MSDFPVYLIDDDDSVRRSIGFMLKTSGLKVEAFPNGVEFLKAVRNLDPGVILLDIRMPDMDGLEIQAELNGRGISLPVIVMTGHGDVEVAVRAMKGGALDFIEKPFDKAVLLESLAEGFSRLEHSGKLSGRREEAQRRLNGLTPRERDVLAGLAVGYPNKTIGYDLGISARTVEIHRANLMKKLEVTNISDLLRIAFAAGLGEA
ncbi:MAG: response regulator transcription factor [Novosphingobium sp.]|nr:response regulator transcription factor [Novosphingobium sp.]